VDSGTGVAFTRDPGTGAQGGYGDYLPAGRAPQLRAAWSSAARLGIELAEPTALAPVTRHHQHHVHRPPSTVHRPPNEQYTL